MIKGNRLALLEALNQQAIPAGFAPGQQLRGEVMAALGGGRFSVPVLEDGRTRLVEQLRRCRTYTGRDEHQQK